MPWERKGVIQSGGMSTREEIYHSSLTGDISQLVDRRYPKILSRSYPKIVD